MAPAQIDDSSPKPDPVLTIVGPVKSFLKSYHNDTYDAINPLNSNLTGKSVVITGASKGIGYATALSFATAGCSKIAVAARSPLTELHDEILAAAKKANREEPLVITQTVDVTSEEDVKSFAEAVNSKFSSKVDILINNAGFLDEWQPLASTESLGWWKTWEVNIKGLYLCSKYFMPLILASDMKTILNISSLGAHATSHGASAYQTSKFAVCRLTEFMASDYHDQGLISISMHPGGILTELAQNLPVDHHRLLTDTVELPADMMVWLARERREWLNGRFICVNWDVNELEERKKEIVEGDLLKFRMRV